MCHQTERMGLPRPEAPISAREPTHPVGPWAQARGFETVQIRFLQSACWKVHYENRTDRSLLRAFSLLGSSPSTGLSGTGRSPSFRPCSAPSSCRVCTTMSNICPGEGRFIPAESAMALGWFAGHLQRWVSAQAVWKTAVEVGHLPTGARSARWDKWLHSPAFCLTKTALRPKFLKCPLSHSCPADTLIQLA